MIRTIRIIYQNTNYLVQMSGKAKLSTTFVNQLCCTFDCIYTFFLIFLRSPWSDSVSEKLMQHCYTHSFPLFSGCVDCFLFLYCMCTFEILTEAIHNGTLDL